MTDCMDYRQMPTLLQEFLFKRWLKQAKKEAVEFRMHAEQSHTKEVHSTLSHVTDGDCEGRKTVRLHFENRHVLEVLGNGVSDFHPDRCNPPDCICPRVVLYSYRVEGGPEWHDFEDWLAQVGLDFRDDDEEFELPRRVAA